MQAQITLRPFEPGDRAFVLDSFLRGFGRSAYGEGVPARVLINMMEPLLVAWDVTVAVAPDGELLGWIVARAPDAVGWLHVKPAFRRRGIGKALLARAGVGKMVSAPFVATKLFDRPFMAVVAEKGYRVRMRPYLPACAMYELEVACSGPGRRGTDKEAT